MHNIGLTTIHIIYKECRIQGANSATAPIQFGYRLLAPLQRSDKREMLGKILNCPEPIVWIPHMMWLVAPNRMSGSAADNLGPTL